MTIAIVRGAFLNQFEMQNYEPLLGRHKVVGFSSLRPLHSKFLFPVVKLLSPFDLLTFLPENIRPIPRGILNRIFSDAQLLFGLEKNLRGFEIAHCAETYYHYTQQCLNAKKKGYVKKVVCTVWENIPFNNEKIRGRKMFKKRAIEEIDHFLAVTNGAKEALISEGCDWRKISVIPMGIDLRKFQMKTNVKYAKEKLTILFVGRLEKEKGVWELLEVFKKIITAKLRNTNRYQLKMIGDGNLKKDILRRGKEWGIGEKIRIEKVAYEKMPQVYQESDIFVLPSKPTKYWQEQFGMVLVEAMASGKPVVSTTSGAIPEVVGGEAGILVPPGDTKALYQALKNLIENPQLRWTQGKKGRERAEKYFDCQKAAKNLEDLYLNLFP